MSRHDDDEASPQEQVLYLEGKIAGVKVRYNRCQQSVADYKKLLTELSRVADEPRRHVMASVCNGLAYFDAVVDNTNNITVLLGDSWFAERSTRQASGIAERRLEFLRKEEAVLKGHIEQLQTTLKMAREESATTGPRKRSSNSSSTYANGGGAENGNDDEEEDDDDDDDVSASSSFAECDLLNLRELEELEADMLRETGGGEWSDEVLDERVRARQTAKRERRLAEERKALDSLSPAAVKLQETKLLKEEAAKKTANSLVPKHPGQVGGGASALVAKEEKTVSPSLTVANAQRELEAAFGPRRPTQQESQQGSANKVVVPQPQQKQQSSSLAPALAPDKKSLAGQISESVPFALKPLSPPAIAASAPDAMKRSDEDAPAAVPKKKSLFSQRREQS